MPRGRITFEVSDPDAPVFVISVAAELSGMHPQTLRTYDRIGLVRPGRTGGGGRRYSARDIDLLRSVAQLTSSGIGIEGVRRILELEHEVETLRARIVDLQTDLDLAMQAAMPNLPVLRSGSVVTRWQPGGARPPRRPPPRPPDGGGQPLTPPG